MTTLREFLSDLRPALNLATLAEIAFIGVFLVGTFVAFALAVSP